MASKLVNSVSLLFISSIYVHVCIHRLLGLCLSNYVCVADFAETGCNIWLWPPSSRGMSQGFACSYVTVHKQNFRGSGILTLLGKFQLPDRFLSLFLKSLAPVRPYSVLSFSFIPKGRVTSSSLLLGIFDDQFGVQFSVLLISSGRLRVYRFSQPCLKSYHYLCPYGEMVMEWEFLCTDARRDECLSRFCSFNHCA